MIPIPLRWLTAAAGLMSALLGGLGALAGFGLGSAAFIMPPQNVEMATLLAVAGVCQVGCSPWIWRARLPAVAIGAVSSLVVAAYFALKLGDFGETFWLHVVLLVVLTHVAFRLADMRAAPAGPPA